MIFHELKSDQVINLSPESVCSKPSTSSPFPLEWKKDLCKDTRLAGDQTLNKEEMVPARLEFIVRESRQQGNEQPCAQIVSDCDRSMTTLLTWGGGYLGWGGGGQGGPLSGGDS